MNTAITGVAVAVSFFNNKPVPDSAIESEEGHAGVSGVTLVVGKPAPAFSLTAMDGNSVSLADFRGGGVVLIFYRGEWCPFCVNHLEDINTVLPELNEMGVQVMAISPEGIPELAVIERYGIRRDEKLPHPAVVVSEALRFNDD